MSKVGVAILAIGEAEGALVAAIDRDPELSVIRRCADVAEVYAAIRAGIASVAVIDTHDPDVDAGMVAEVKQSHAMVILLAGLTNAAEFKTWGADGVAQPAAPASVVESIHAALRGQGDTDADATHQPAPALVSQTSLQETSEKTSKLIAVWGTSGAPGRSSVAMMLAASLSEHQATLLIDADTANPSLTTMLSLDSDAVGMGALARLAHRGQLTPAEITRTVTSVGPQWDVIPGLSSPQRFRELSILSLHQILTHAKSCAPLVVVDCASGSGDPVEGEGERRPTTRDEQVGEVLRMADHVVLVGRGDVLGIERLEHAYAWWKDLALDTPMTFLVNRVSALTAGARPANAVAQSLTPIAAGQQVWVIPEDQRVAAALLHAAVPTVTKNGAAHTISRLAAELIGEDEDTSAGPQQKSWKHTLRQRRS